MVLPTLVPLILEPQTRQHEIEKSFTVDGIRFTSALQSGSHVAVEFLSMVHVLGTTKTGSATRPTENKWNIWAK
jgi:hypothetical protein